VAKSSSVRSTTRRAVILSLVTALAVPSGLGMAAADSAEVVAANGSWASDFGGGEPAAFQSIGDGLSSTGWNGRSNVSFRSFEGREALSLRLPADRSDGMKLRSRFSELGFAERSGVRLEYDVFVGSEQDLGLDLKLPGIASAPRPESVWYASSGGTKQDDSGSVRLHLRPAGNFGVPHPYLDAYAYAHGGDGQQFDQWGLYWRLAEGLNASGRVRGDEFRVPVGEWFTVTLEAEMNAPGKANGELRVWLNGRLGVDIADMEWVRSAPYVWTQTMFDAFYNTGAHPEATLRLANMSMRSVGVPVAPPEPAAPPVASFRVMPAEPRTGETVTFDATTSERAVSWAWEDAAPGDWPLGSDEQFTFTFQNPGTKQVRLTVTDAMGRTDTLTHPVVVHEAPAPVPSSTDRWTFDGGVQGWGPGQSGDRVFYERSHTHEGSGALRGRTRFGAGTTGTLRFRSEAGARDWSAAGGELGTWILVPGNAGGSNWQARVEVQDGTRYAYTSGTLVSLQPGTWTYVSHDFGARTEDVHRVAVHVQAWNVGGDRNVYVDTVRQTR
jgi:hypothetical protein